MLVDNKAHFQSESLTNSHIGLAVDFMHKAYEISKKDKSPRSELVRRYSLSSILHGFCALDSEINHLGISIFYNPSSELYLREEKRSFLLEKFIKSWDTKSTLEKLKVILEYSGQIPISTATEAKLRELNTLRNWLAHGLSFVTSLTLELISEEVNENGSTQQFNVLNKEKGIDWEKKFPNTKFSLPQELNPYDAQTALKIVIEVFKSLIKIKSIGPSIVTYEKGINVFILAEGRFENLNFLELK